MPDALAYRIGGLKIVVRSPDVPVAGERDPDYLPFVAQDAAAADVRIDLRDREPSLPPDARQVFEAGESWTAHERGGELLIAPRVEPPATRPDWVAAAGPGRRRVTIDCSEALLTGDGGRRLTSPFHYPLDQILLSLALAGEGLILHAAGVDLGGRGLVLAGASGAGKTTIARLCAAAGHPVLSDDRVIVRRRPEGWRLFGTPWPGEGKFADNRDVALSALVLLSKGEENRLLTRDGAGVARRVLPLATVPWFDPEPARRCLDLLAGLAAAVPLRELVFRPDRGAVQALAEC